VVVWKLWVKPGYPGEVPRNGRPTPRSRSSIRLPVQEPVTLRVTPGLGQPCARHCIQWLDCMGRHRQAYTANRTRRRGDIKDRSGAGASPRLLSDGNDMHIHPELSKRSSVPLEGLGSNRGNAGRLANSRVWPPLSTATADLRQPQFHATVYFGG